MVYYAQRKQMLITKELLQKHNAPKRLIKLVTKPIDIQRLMKASVLFNYGNAGMAVWLANEFNHPLPEGFKCKIFHARESFNQPLPKGFECEIFDAGDSFNQPLPEGFKCKKTFSAGKKFNQPLPEGFECVCFYAADSFNQPLPKGFKCEHFTAGESFNQPLPAGFTCKEFYAGSKFNQPLPRGVKIEMFDAGDSFNQPIPEDFECKKFYSGKSFNQPFPEGFTCYEFSPGESFYHTPPIEKKVVEICGVKRGHYELMPYRSKSHGIRTCDNVNDFEHPRKFKFKENEMYIMKWVLTPDEIEDALKEGDYLSLDMPDKLVCPYCMKKLREHISPRYSVL